MLSIDKRQTRLTPVRLALVVAAALILAGVAGWSVLHQASAAAPVPAGETVNPPAPPTVLIFVSGAVAHPGLYELSPGARVADAIAAAGGVTTLADPGHLPDMAQRVNDGRQINVPFMKTGTTAAKLDINTAAEAELELGSRDATRPRRRDRPVPRRMGSVHIDEPASRRPRR